MMFIEFPISISMPIFLFEQNVFLRLGLGWLYQTTRTPWTHHNAIYVHQISLFSSRFNQTSPKGDPDSPMIDALKTLRSWRPYYWLLYNGICKGLDCRDIWENRLPFISISFFCGGQCEYSRVTNTVSTSPFWVASSAKTYGILV